MNPFLLFVIVLSSMVFGFALCGYFCSKNIRNLKDENYFLNKEIKRLENLTEK